MSQSNTSSKLSQKEIETWLKENKNLLGYWANRFKGYKQFDNEELVSIATVGALIGLKKYDKSFGTKINNYVTNDIRANLQKEHRAALKHHKNLTPHDVDLHQIYKEETSNLSEYNIEEKTEIEDSLENAFKHLTPFERECVEYTYNTDSYIDKQKKPIAKVVAMAAIKKMQRKQKNQ